MKSIRAECRPEAATPPSPTARPPTDPPHPTRRALRIAVIGSGYVGVVTAACFASNGHNVVAIDADAPKVARLSSGDVVVHELGLSELVREQLDAGRLQFTTDTEQSLRKVDLVFVAVGTPARRDGSAEMSAIEAVTACLAKSVRAPTVVVIKSTVPIGTTQRIQAQLRAERIDPLQAPAVLVNPEFLRQGTAVADCLTPERIVIGTDQPGSPAHCLLLEAYGQLVDAGVSMLTMDTRSAELTKHAANAMLATRISFVNEIAAIASATGADIERVCEGVGSDPRIGTAFLRPGLGYGGSCFPKDVAALRETARRHNLRADLLLATERVNDRQRCWAFAALQRDVGSRARLRTLRVAIWGLAFKPGTDDMRSAPSVALIDRLVRAGVTVALYDPAAMDNARCVIADHRRIGWATSAMAALEGADALILVTEWPEFIGADPAAAAEALGQPTVYDGRNALDAKEWERAGLRVVQVGRPTAPVPVGKTQRAEVAESDSTVSSAVTSPMSSSMSSSMSSPVSSSLSMAAPVSRSASVPVPVRMSTGPFDMAA